MSVRRTNPLCIIHTPASGHEAPSTTLVTLEQALAPRVTPPGPMQGLVRGLCGRVLQNMMADLKTELERRQAAGGCGGLRKGKEMYIARWGCMHYEACWEWRNEVDRGSFR
jgi:hypothetical protein